MIDLNNVTLFSIASPKHIYSTIKAMDYCLKKAKFYSAKILTNRYIKEHDRIKNIIIDNDLDQITYSRICINYLNDYIDSDYVLMVQWDGFLINEKLWNNEFFNYDYIGAPWGYPDDCKNRVGNGGFSLRSKKFLKLASRLEYTPFDYDVYNPLLKFDRPIAPEDWFLCYHSYEYFIKNKIKFADIKTAYSFSVEHPSNIKMYDRNNIKTYQSFGFHGDFNTAAMNLLEI